MSLSKFIYLLEKGLWAPSPNAFWNEDYLEGLYPINGYNDKDDAWKECYRKAKEMHPDWPEDQLVKYTNDCMRSAERRGYNITLDMMSNFKKILSLTTQFCYVSCWHKNHNESAAMWKLYSPNDDGIAIKINRAQLEQHFNELGDHYFIQDVRYITDKEYIARDPVELLSLKGLHYEHEKEVRIISTENIPSLFELHPYYETMLPVDAEWTDSEISNFKKEKTTNLSVFNDTYDFISKGELRPLPFKKHADKLIEKIRSDKKAGTTIPFNLKKIGAKIILNPFIKEPELTAVKSVIKKYLGEFEYSESVLTPKKHPMNNTLK